MKITGKIFIIIALICVSAAAAYSQDCNSYLKRAAELVSQKKYCDAKKYYQDYKKCNADADVSTEIAMCERFCKIRVGTGEETENQNVIDNTASTDMPSNRSAIKQPIQTDRLLDRYTDKPTVQSVNTNAKFKLDFNGGLMSTFEKESKMYFGGGISGEYLVTPNIGIGLGVGYYTNSVTGYIEDYGVNGTVTSSFIPVTLFGRYYFLTKSIQPYAGVDIGLYNIGGKVEYEGESESGSISNFGLAPVLGLQFKLSKTLALDVNAKYNYIFIKEGNGYNFCFNVGIVYTFGK
jgi:outer membrane protein W